MTDSEAGLRREVDELRTEVTRLRQLIERVTTGIVVAVVLLFPSLLVFAAAIGGAILFALLVSPVRHLIFPSVFDERKRLK
jgi:hypothetical protein